MSVARPPSPTRMATSMPSAARSTRRSVTRMSKRTPLWRWPKASMVSQRGSKWGGIEIRSVPETPEASCTSCSACVSRASAGAADAKSRAPASVRVRPWVLRSTRRTPRDSSRLRTRRLSVARGTPVRRAASPRLPAWAAATNKPTEFRSTFALPWLSFLRGIVSLFPCTRSIPGWLSCFQVVPMRGARRGRPGPGGARSAR
jgi:hypothetical protein